MSAKEKDSKKKEDLKSFTVGSVQKGVQGAKSAKSGKAERFEIKEKDFPVLAGLRKAKDKQPFQQELQRVLLAVGDVVQNGPAEEKKSAEKVQRAYALALAVLENGKLIR